MIEFLEDLVQHSFLRHALLAGVLVSIASGIVGTYVVTRRISYIAGSIAHCVLGGIGAALYLQKVHHLNWMRPIYGAIASALAAAFVIGFVSLRAKEREDTVIGAVWAIGMAAGILLIWKTPGYHANLVSYLFGNILMVTSRELWLLTGLDLLVVVTVLIFYHHFLAVCFDAEFAQLRGLKVELYYLLLLCLVAVTIVLMVTVVGVIMVIALLTLPAAVAGKFSKKLWQMMVIAAMISSMLTTAGIAISYSPNLPSGATIILLAGVVYMVITIGKGLFTTRNAR